MKHRVNKFLLIPVIILLIAGIWYLYFYNQDRGRAEVVESIEPVDFFAVPINYNWQIFSAAITEYPKSSDTRAHWTLGLIVPHHDLAGKYVAEIMQKISDERVNRIILIGPNHFESGGDDIVSGMIKWQLPDGVVETDTLAVDFLVREKQAVVNNEIFINEHSVNALVPYIHYYFPNAKIVPMILKQGTPLSKANELAEKLRDLSDDRTLIIGSIDFSHYLTTEEAGDKDKITQTVIESRDYEKLYSFNNDYIDSPATAVVVLQAVDLLGARSMEIVRNANQADAVGLPYVESSTSYFTILFKKTNPKK